MIKKQRKELSKTMKETLEELGATKTESAMYDWTMPTIYGNVLISFHNADCHKSAPWLACRLDDWGAEQGTFFWYGWEHWKNNAHPGCGHKPEDYAGYFKRHLERFNVERNHGLPSDEELNETRKAKAERWAAFKSIQSNN